MTVPGLEVAGPEAAGAAAVVAPVGWPEPAAVQPGIEEEVVAAAPVATALAAEGLLEAVLPPPEEAQPAL